MTAGGLILTGVILGCVAVAAPPAASEDVVARLDAALAAKWANLGISPPATADDATFLRRVWLDLAGRVPSALAARDFLDDVRADKRTRLVDELLASDDFADHWAKSWTIRLTEKRPIRHAVHDGRVLQAWLREALATGKSYRQIVGELVGGEGARDASGPANFLLRYDAQAEALAAAVGRQFMGATLQCAECHDHVFAHWKQEDFRGMAAFFGRLKMMGSNDGTLTAVIEATRGDFQVATAMKPDENGAIPMKVVAPRLPGGREVGGHTGPARRRSALVTWLTADDNPWFARHAVNSTWQELLGTPLVSTLDDPEVAARGRMGDMLDILAADFVAGGYRLKPLIRSIVLSRAYQSAPAVPREGADDAALVARRESYAAYPTRPLTVDQLYDSLIQATGARSSEEATPESPPAVESPDDEALAYADRPVESLGEHGVSLQRALVMLNGATAQEAARSAARIAVTLHGRRIGRAHVEWLFLSTLSRRPAEDELSTMIELVGSDRGARGLEDVAWVLVNSAEFQTNH